MTPEEMRDARETIGKALGLGRPVAMAEFGRMIGLTGRDPGAGVRDYERGTTRISGPLTHAVHRVLVRVLPADDPQRLELEAQLDAMISDAVGGWGGARSRQPQD